MLPEPPLALSLSMLSVKKFLQISPSVKCCLIRSLLYQLESLREASQSVLHAVIATVDPQVGLGILGRQAVTLPITSYRTVLLPS